MNINQKVFAIVKKDTKEIVMFGLNARKVKEEWDIYYEGVEGSENLELLQTFMPQDEIRKQMLSN